MFQLIRSLFSRRPQGEVSNPRPAVDCRDLRFAVAEISAVFADYMTSMHIGPHLTCGEADQIACALKIAGYEDAAVTLLAGHGLGDDEEGDLHAEMTESRARAYLAPIAA